MCGRIFIRPDAKNATLLHHLGLDRYSLPDAPNIAPTEAVPVIHYWEDELTLSPMRWWLVPSWSDGPSQKFAMFNARIETVASSRAYKGPLRYRRGILPASGFIEWQRRNGHKQPYYFEGTEEPLAFAAIWDIWQEELLSTSILTQPADGDFQRYHDRMPVMLSAREVDSWLDHSLSPDEVIAAVSGARIDLNAREVSDSINNARHKVWV